MELSIKDNPRYNWWLVLGLLAAIYLLVNLGLRHLPISSFARTYVVQPILWGLLAWAILALPGYRATGRLRVKTTILQLALMIGFFRCCSMSSAVFSPGSARVRIPSPPVAS